MTLAEIEALFQGQVDHPVYPKIDAAMLDMGLTQGELAEVVALVRHRTRAIEMMKLDPYNHGYEPGAWDEIDWLVCEKRVANPGVVIKVLVMGGNGGGKTFFCSNRFVRFAIENQLEDGLAWVFSYDEQSSRRIPQPAVHRYLPMELRPESGKVPRTANQKINHNAANGFTDNTFSTPSAIVCEFRFYSSDIEKMEGPRPYLVWWDEESPLPWVDAMTARLHSRAEGTTAFMEDFKRLLLQKKENPKMKFPRERLKDLYRGVNLGSFTPTRGYTATVKRYMDGGTVTRTVDATLLPKIKAADGSERFEKMPKVIQCEDKTAFVYFLHAWDNPFAGNWPGMQIAAQKMTRENILWWVYGVATKTSGTPFPMFSKAAHVRKFADVVKPGFDATITLTVDPVANGGRCWFMQWQAVTPLGDKIIIREFPQRGEFVEGYGVVGEWALQGGKNTALGKRGPATEAWSYGFAEWAAQIRRIENELSAIINGRLEPIPRSGLPRFKDPNWTAEQELYALAKHPEPPPLKVFERIMDSRSGNTVSLSSEGGKTLIECMEDEKLFFISAGKDTPNAGSNRRTSVGEQIIKAELIYDQEKAEYDSEKERMIFKGKAPKLFILDNCENTIDAFQNYPGADAGDSAWDDPIDCARYWLISDPEYIDPNRQQVSSGGYLG